MSCQQKHNIVTIWARNHSTASCTWGIQRCVKGNPIYEPLCIKLAVQNRVEENSLLHYKWRKCKVGCAETQPINADYSSEGMDSNDDMYSTSGATCEHVTRIKVTLITANTNTLLQVNRAGKENSSLEWNRLLLTAYFTVWCNRALDLVFPLVALVRLTFSVGRTCTSFGRSFLFIYLFDTTFD